MVSGLTRAHEGDEALSGVAHLRSPRRRPASSPPAAAAAGSRSRPRPAPRSNSVRSAHASSSAEARPPGPRPRAGAREGLGLEAPPGRGDAVDAPRVAVVGELRELREQPVGRARVVAGGRQGEVRLDGLDPQVERHVDPGQRGRQAAPHPVPDVGRRARGAAPGSRSPRCSCGRSSSRRCGTESRRAGSCAERRPLVHVAQEPHQVGHADGPRAWTAALEGAVAVQVVGVVLVGGIAVDGGEVEGPLRYQPRSRAWSTSVGEHMKLSRSPKSTSPDPVAVGPHRHLVRRRPSSRPTGRRGPAPPTRRRRDRRPPPSCRSRSSGRGGRRARRPARRPRGPSARARAPAAGTRSR